MPTLNPSPLLRLALRLDAAASLGAGALICALAAPLQMVIGATSGRIVAAGVFMLGYGLLLAWLGTRSQLGRGVVWTVIIGNLAWVAGSAALAFSTLIAPTLIGKVLILGQAAAVLVLAELQYFGLHRSGGSVPSVALEQRGRGAVLSTPVGPG